MGLGFGIAAAALAGLYLLFAPSGATSASLTAREETMKALGASIARLRPGAKTLVLSNPFAKESGYLDTRSRHERAGIRGLREGLGRGAAVEVAFPEIRPEYFQDPGSVLIPPDSRTPLSFLVRPESVEKLADARPDFGVIVSLIGLPVGVDQLRIWSQEDPRAFALLLPDLRVLGPPEKALEAFERGKLLAVVAEDPATGAPLVVTRENAAETLRNQPRVLGY
jgi:hypothetical protein